MTLLNFLKDILSDESLKGTIEIENNDYTKQRPHIQYENGRIVSICDFKYEYFESEIEKVIEYELPKNIVGLRNFVIYFLPFATHN